ncbi:hypothetical protein [Streptomyces anulatus]|uniref:hypothetical protein n=1 Tax=Streptomyces anulatus TaxID=1892 RepID=UPI00386D60CC
MTFPAAKALEKRRDEAYHAFTNLIAGARATGYLREDFDDRDMPILLMANAGVVNATGDAAPDTWQRLVAHMLRSFATPDAPLPPLPEAPAPAALYRAMVRSSRPSENRTADV